MYNRIIFLKIHGENKMADHTQVELMPLIPAASKQAQGAQAASAPLVSSDTLKKVEGLALFSGGLGFIPVGALGIAGMINPLFILIPVFVGMSAAGVHLCAKQALLKECNELIASTKNALKKDDPQSAQTRIEDRKDILETCIKRLTDILGNCPELSNDAEFDGIFKELDLLRNILKNMLAKRAECVRICDNLISLTKKQLKNCCLQGAQTKMALFGKKLKKFQEFFTRKDLDKFNGELLLLKTNIETLEADINQYELLTAMGNAIEESTGATQKAILAFDEALENAAKQGARIDFEQARKTNAQKVQPSNEDDETRAQREFMNRLPNYYSTIGHIRKDELLLKKRDAAQTTPAVVAQSAPATAPSVVPANAKKTVAVNPILSAARPATSVAPKKMQAPSPVTAKASLKPEDVQARVKKMKDELTQFNSIVQTGNFSAKDMKDKLDRLIKEADAICLSISKDPKLQLHCFVEQATCTRTIPDTARRILREIEPQLKKESSTFGSKMLAFIGVKKN
jgi:hypothetical protein